MQLVTVPVEKQSNKKSRDKKWHGVMWKAITNAMKFKNSCLKVDMEFTLSKVTIWRGSEVFAWPLALVELRTVSTSTPLFLLRNRRKITYFMNYNRNKIPLTHHNSFLEIGEKKLTLQITNFTNSNKNKMPEWISCWFSNLKRMAHESNTTATTSTVYCDLINMRENSFWEWEFAILQDHEMIFCFHKYVI